MVTIDPRVFVLKERCARGDQSWQDCYQTDEEAMDRSATHTVVVKLSAAVVVDMTDTNERRSVKRAKEKEKDGCINLAFSYVLHESLTTLLSW